MKIIYTVDDCYNESAGPSYSVPGMCHAVTLNGAEAHLHTSGLLPPKKVSFDFNAYEHKRDLFPWPNLFPSRSMKEGLREDCANADIVHANTVWRLPTVYANLARRGTSAKLVLSPRGALSAVARHRSWWKKWMAMRMGVADVLRETDMFHVTSPKERDEVRELGYKQPIMFVPVGIDVPDLVGDVSGSGRIAGESSGSGRLEGEISGSGRLAGENSGSGSCGRKVIAFFGRVHVTKACDHLVQAWGEVCDRFPDWEVQIAGPDCGAVPGLKNLIAERRIPRVSFVGELHGKDKFEFLTKADLYCLPSLTENFGITIAEALACGTPVIASYGSPWPGLEEHGCGWWLPIGPDALANQLDETLAMPIEALRAMGQRGREWMKRDYSWQGVGRQLLEGYRWIRDPEHLPKPSFVY